MKTFIKIYKAILLWATAFSIILFIAGLESMITEGMWTLILVWAVINYIFYWICKTQITYRELYKLSGSQYLEDLLK